ncbi:MAG: ROK family protein [Burkholderiales bacterium]|nr:ROK family protein [Burkholderiales bacterium]
MTFLADLPRLWFSSAAAPRHAGPTATRPAEGQDPTGQRRLLKGINRMALVRQLCVKPGLSRADLATCVRLTKSTVGLLVRELIAEGWLHERDCVPTGDIGRRPTPLYIDPTRLVLLGVDIGIDSTRLVATSLLGEVLGRLEIQHEAGPGAQACIGRLAASLSALHRQIGDSARQVLGIGIGLPGGVDETSGFLHFAPNLGWREVPIGALLESALAGTALAGVPLFVQNEADVAALGELEFDADGAADPLLYVSINQGVGAGVIVGDRLLIGSRGFAGEIGHTILQPGGPLCSCGRRGCAEALIGMRAMLPPPGGAAQGSRAATVASIAARLSAGDIEMLQSVAFAGNHLGTLLQNLAAAYDPACIVLGGAGVALGDRFVEPALSTLRAHCAAADLPMPTVRLSRHGADAVAMGAAALVRYRMTRPLISATSTKVFA